MCLYSKLILFIRTTYWARVNRKLHLDHHYRYWTFPIRLIEGEGVVSKDIKTILEPARVYTARARARYVVCSYALLF